MIQRICVGLEDARQNARDIDFEFGFVSGSHSVLRAVALGSVGGLTRRVFMRCWMPDTWSLDAHRDERRPHRFPEFLRLLFFI